MEEITNNLIRGLKQYFQKTGFVKAVVGVSGGVDSAVTTALAVKALGKENVCGIPLPHPAFSGAENLNDARELGKILGIQTEEIRIDDFTDPFFDIPWVAHHVTKANVLARIRMIILYSWANEHNALVLGTCNKSETLLGYETKFGDGACDISVLGDLWKTEVWKLAKYLELPEKFINKPPSAELWEGHTDEEEMGYTYGFADEVLRKWEKGEELDESNSKISDILKRIRVHEHKRKFPPTLLK